MAEALPFQHFEIKENTRRDEDPENREELALLEKIRFAGFPDGVGDVAHRFVHRQRLGLLILHQAKDRACRANQDAQIHERQAAHTAQSAKRHRLKVRDFDVRFAP